MYDKHVSNRVINHHLNGLSAAIQMDDKPVSNRIITTIQMDYQPVSKWIISYYQMDDQPLSNRIINHIPIGLSTAIQMDDKTV